MDEKLIEKILSQMIEVELPREDSFLVLKETLTRIGMASTQSKTLTQSCHILHKRGKYYITHFKLLFELDGKASNFDEKDRARMNTIAALLESWGLLKIKNKTTMKNFIPTKKIKIIPASEKDQWNLVAKHRIGSTRK
jgi:very-short-patch-repair endonuclease